MHEVIRYILQVTVMKMNLVNLLIIQITFDTYYNRSKY